MLILIDEARGLAVNPEDISTMHVTEELIRSTAAMAIWHFLRITMKTGEELTVTAAKAQIAHLHQRLLESK